MAVNENIIKNMANEVTREAQFHNVTVDPYFAIYLVELLLLNPKYGKLFTRTLNRENLEYFVNEVVAMLVRKYELVDRDPFVSEFVDFIRSGDISINVMKMQFLMSTKYDRLNALIDKHILAIEDCLKPLLNEILDDVPDADNEVELKKLFRKISLYIILLTGLGDPSNIQTLKESIGALESVFSMEELKALIHTARGEKMVKIRELAEIVGGVRLFNRDCYKGGEGITDLPAILVDSGKTCLAVLSNTMISIMQRVHGLTALVDSVTSIDNETGNVRLKMKSGYRQEDYDHVFDLLALDRQYEVFIRTLLMDTETLVQSSFKATERAKTVLKEIHEVVEYRTGVPVAIIYPLFKKNFQAYRDMQNIMYLVSAINKIAAQLADIYDEIKPLQPQEIEAMTPEGNNEESAHVDRGRAASQMIMKNFITQQSDTVVKDSYLHMLGFCAMCLIVGALVPSVVRAGVVRARGMRYGFCNQQMKQWFASDPERYINEFLEYVRNHPHLIRLLKLYSDVEAVRDVHQLTVERVAKVHVADCAQQTGHPLDSYIDRHYSWDMWEWKRRACLWATLVNCRTHASQTLYSHHRAEIQCQTVEPRDKSLQTKKETGVNTLRNNYFLWGLRGQLGLGQHMIDFTESHMSEKLQPQVFETCSWPCLQKPEATSKLVFQQEEQKPVTGTAIQPMVEQVQEEVEIQQSGSQRNSKSNHSFADSVDSAMYDDDVGLEEAGKEDEDA